MMPTRRRPPRRHITRLYFYGFLAFRVAADGAQHGSRWFLALGRAAADAFTPAKAALILFSCGFAGATFA